MRPYPSHFIYIYTCIWEFSALVAHQTSNVVRIIFHEHKLLLWCACGVLVANIIPQGCTSSSLSDITACCWDTSDMLCGRVSPKFGLLFSSLYLENVPLVAAIPAPPVSFPAPTLVMCSVPHVTSTIILVSKQPQDLGQGWEPWVGWHLCKNTCAGGMLLIAPWPCTASSRQPVARSSVHKVFSDIFAFAERSATPLAGDGPLLLLFITA